MSERISTEPTETLNVNEIIRNQIMGSYESRLTPLKTALEETRRDEDPHKPRGAVVVSLWEQDDSLLTTKMFKRSLEELLNQAKKSEIDLDFFIVANNGGGSSAELGSQLKASVCSKIEELGGQVTKASTTRPEGLIDATTPWDLELPVGRSNPAEPGSNRFFLVEQEKDVVNKGKLRAVRDASTALSKAILEKGYAPDFIFQMDAETILEYRDPILAEAVPPFKAMYNQLTRGNKVAVGTKDRFAIMDPKTGEPLATPVGSAQKGYELTNTAKNFITLPGGALMAKTENYLAAMPVIAEVTPSMGVEDYMFTKMLREEAKQNGQNFEEDTAKSMAIITHLNRTPEGWREALQQMRNWKTHALAADEIFPDHPYNQESIHRYTFLVVTQRVSEALKLGPEHVAQLIRDIATMPAAMELLSDQVAADIFTKSGGITWTAGSALTLKRL